MMLTRHDSRVLDPSTAARSSDITDLRATVYVGASLLSSKGDWDDEVLRQCLEEAAYASGLRLGEPVLDQDLYDIAVAHGLRDLADRIVTVSIPLLPREGVGASAPPDAWKVLQHFRSQVRGERGQLAHRVTLDHLLTVNDAQAAGFMGTGFMGTGFMGTGFMGTGFMGTGFMGTGFMGTGFSSPIAEYGLPGRGGRGPVAWLGPEPARVPDDQLRGRRPVVAILDSGVGKHWWLPDSIVDRNPTVDSTLPIGLHSQGKGSTDRSTAATLDGLLQADEGHGTFIAGLIRQTCPDADILAVKVMLGDGTVPESQFLGALNRLVMRQAIALATGREDFLVDVVSLSLGYYHELPADQAADHKVLIPLAELGKLGVLTVAAAGNDATNRHFYPAGFAPHAQSRLPASRNALPVISVGALNPDQRVEALFSNDGDWVLCLRPGAALVSTMPTDLDGALQASAALNADGAMPRATIDPDDYRSGFATWSGTSFAAPVLAGQLAENLRKQRNWGTVTKAAAVTRGWQAVTKLVHLARPSSATETRHGPGAS